MDESLQAPGAQRWQEFLDARARERTERVERRRERARARCTADVNRRINLATKYGITPEEYEALRVAQNYRCAICAMHESDLPRSTGRPRKDGSRADGTALAVDHCHTTGNVRALLCHRCNQMLGMARESEATLRSAISYLRTWRDEVQR